MTATGDDTDKNEMSMEIDQPTTSRPRRSLRIKNIKLQLEAASTKNTVTDLSEEEKDHDNDDEDGDNDDDEDDIEDSEEEEEASEDDDDYVFNQRKRKRMTRKIAKVRKDDDSEEKHAPTKAKKEQRVTKARKNPYLWEPDAKIVKVLEKMTADECHGSEEMRRRNTATPITASREALRAVETKNIALLKEIIDDLDNVSNPLISRSPADYTTALDIALLNNDTEAIKLLLEYNKKRRFEKRVNISNGLMRMTSGHYGGRFGRRRAIGISRGGKEGQNALLDDALGTYDRFFDIQNIIRLSCRYNLTSDTVDLLLTELPHERSVFSDDGFYEACQSGQQRLAHYIAQNLLKWGYGVNSLHVTALSPDGESFDKYRTVSVKKKHAGAFGITPIHCAAINSNTDYLKELIDAAPGGQHVVDNRGRKLIHFAAAAESSEPLTYLLDSGADVEVFDNKNNLPLHLAAKFGRSDNIKLLLEDENIKTSTINAKSKDSFTALHTASYFGHLDAVKVLLEAGAIVDIQTNKKETPLISAASRGHMDIVKFLMENGAQIQKVDKTKKSALHHAVKNGHFDVVKLLITTYNANPNSVDSSGNCVLQYAAAYGWLSIVRLLVTAGANVNSQNDWKGTALLIAITKGHMDIADYLLGVKGIDPDIPDCQGRTLLLNSLVSKSDDSLKQVRYICEMENVNFKAVDHQGRGLFHYLAMIPGENDVEIATLLISKKIPMEEKDDHGMTPLMLAVCDMNAPIISFLLSNQVKNEIVNDRSNLLHLLVKNVMKSDLCQVLDILVQQLEKSELQEMANCVNEQGYTPFLLLLSHFTANAPEMRYDSDEEELHVDGSAGNQLTSGKTGDNTTSFLNFLNKYMNAVDVDVNSSVVLVQRKKKTELRDFNTERDDKDEDDDSEDDDSESDNDNDGDNVAKNIGWTPIHFSIAKHNIEMLRFFIQCGADVNVPCARSRTALHYAVNACSSESKNYAMVKMLLRHGANVNAIDIDGRQPVHFIFVPMSSIHDYSSTRFHTYLYHRQTQSQDPIEQISDLAVVEEIELDHADKFGRTPLMYAAAQGATISSMYLLQKGADINRKDEDGNSPLSLSLLGGYVDYAVTLIQKNADTRANVTLLDNIHITHAQAQREKQANNTKKQHKLGSGLAGSSTANQIAPTVVSVFKYVLQRNYMGLAYLLMDMETINPVDAIVDALSTGSYAIVGTLISKVSKRSISTTSVNGQNMFHILADHDSFCKSDSKFKSHVKIAQALRLKGVDFRLADKLGRTPLHHAAIRKNAALVSFFIQHGADINAVDIHQRTALHYSVCVGYPENDIFQLLASHKDVDLNVADEEGKTAVHYIVSPDLFGSFESTHLFAVLDPQRTQFDIVDRLSNPPAFYALIQQSGIMLEQLTSRNATIDDQLKKRARDFMTQMQNDRDVVPERNDIVIDIEDDAAQVVQKLENEWNKKHREKIQQRKIRPDRRADVKRGVILEQDGFTYDVLLSKTSITQGAAGYNNFYIMQIIHNTQQDLYVLFNCWGVVGESGEFQRTPYSDAHEAITEFKKIFRSKTGNHWENCSEDKFVRNINKYKIVFRDHNKPKPKNLLQPLDLRNAATAILDGNLQQLITSLADVAIFKRYLSSVGIFSGTMQHGELTQSTLKLGLEKLNEILEVIKELSQDNTMDIKNRRMRFDELTQMSSDFYEIIPHMEYDSQGAVRPFTSERDVANKIGMISDLMDIEVGTRIAFAAQHKMTVVNPLDYIYHALDCHIVHVSPDALEFSIIHMYMRSNAQQNLLNVFRTTRREEVERFKPYESKQNRLLLWHGSRCSNFISILHGGLKITPSNSQHTGSMFGRYVMHYYLCSRYPFHDYLPNFFFSCCVSGIYFADQFQKSYGYTDKTQNGSSFLLLCEVYLGRSKMLYEAAHGMEKAPLGFDSVHGIGCHRPDPEKKFVTWDGVTIPIGDLQETPKPPEMTDVDHSRWWSLNHNEYIVYDPSQVRIRYVVEVANE